VRLAAALLIVLSFTSLTALAAEPVPTIKWVSPDLAPSTLAAGTPKIIYLNQNGATLTPGAEDPSNNISSIIGATSTVSALGFNATDWATLMQCERDMYAPFNVVVTDVRPAGTDYIQCIVGGTPDQIGMDPSVGGVSPFTCGVLDRSTVFTFNVFGPSPQRLCEVIAQETAHSIGLEHEAYCPDPMTYETGCGAKKFRDYAAPCGTTSPVACMCSTGTTQNSVQMLLAAVGPGEMVPPTLSVTAPMDGATVPPGFAVTGMAMDNYALNQVELDIDGTFVTNSDKASFTMNAPPTVGPGAHKVDVIATDYAGNSTTTTLHVTVGTNCTTASDCAGTDQLCMGGVCFGDIGATCDLSTDCASGLCLALDQFSSICSKACDKTDSSSCPKGYDCNNGNGGTIDKCYPAKPGGGCQATPGGGRTASWLGLAFGLMLVAVRLRRK
jgi:hypothetical protein